MEALTIHKRRTRISAGDVRCSQCRQPIPAGDAFTTVRGFDWCHGCLNKWEDWQAWTSVLGAVALVLFMLIVSLAG